MSILRMSLVALLGLSGTTLSAETFPLVDGNSSDRTFVVSATVSGKGMFRFQSPKVDGAPVELPVTLSAEFEYADRRLPAAGRDEAAYRSLRDYERVQSEIRVESQSSTPILRNDRRRIVAWATRQGVQAYSAGGPLTAAEVELLPYPGESLLLSALLPNRDVSVGETWSPAPWVASALAGTDVAFDHKLTCRLEAVRDDVATVTFEGRVEGAVKGAKSESVLKGSFEYELASASIVKAQLTQDEKRAIGPLSPGMTLSLISTLSCSPAPKEREISDQDAAAVPSETPAEFLRIEQHAPFGVSLACDRDWRLFHQTGEILILRLLDQGGLIAQCNVAPGPTVPAGQQTPGKLFSDAIRQSLGERFVKIINTEELRTTEGLAVYRAIVTGKAKASEAARPQEDEVAKPADDSKTAEPKKELDRIWSYYLVTAPDGRQAELVFTMEPDSARRLGNRDFDLVSSLRFSSPTAPEAATK